MADPIGPRPKCTTRMLGIATNYSLRGRICYAFMRAFAAWRDGIRRVASAPAVIVAAWIATTLVSFPLAVAVRTDIMRSLGASMAADAAASGMNYEWMEEFGAHANGLATTFQPTIVGFAA